jgi:hypothetical protein
LPAFSLRCIQHSITTFVFVVPLVCPLHHCSIEALCYITPIISPHSLATTTLYFTYNNNMSRYNTNASGGLAAAAMLDSIARKENSYKEGIKQNHLLCKTAATRLYKESGDLEETLMMMAKDSSDIIGEDEVQAFLEEQRGRLQKLAESNVLRERTVDTFVSSVKRLQQEVGNGATAQSQSQGSGDDNVVDYEARLNELMDKEDERLQPTRLPVAQENYCRELGTELGEKDAFEKAKNGGDDDDDIEVMMGSRNAIQLKCPVTSQYLEEPVKNKLCGHVFSKRGIMHMLRQGPCRCPVAGCTNGRVTQDQLEDDAATALLVRREVRKLEAADKAKASQAADLVDSDEEEF